MKFFDRKTGKELNWRDIDVPLNCFEEKYFEYYVYKDIVIFEDDSDVYEISYCDYSSSKDMEDMDVVNSSFVLTNYDYSNNDDIFINKYKDIDFLEYQYILYKQGRLKKEDLEQLKREHQNERYFEFYDLIKKNVKPDLKHLDEFEFSFENLGEEKYFEVINFLNNEEPINK